MGRRSREGEAPAEPHFGRPDVPFVGGADILVCPEFASVGGTPPAERTRSNADLLGPARGGRKAPARRSEADRNVCPTFDPTHVFPYTSSTPASGGAPGMEVRSAMQLIATPCSSLSRFLA